MALSKTSTVVSYASQAGQNRYTFDVLVDSMGGVGVRNIKGPNGLDQYTVLPLVVMEDIQQAQRETSDLLAETAIGSGSVDFTSQVSQIVTFDTPLNNTDYRVVLAFDPTGPVGFVQAQAVDGFLIILSAVYTGTVSYVLLQKASEVGSLSGALSFTSAGTTQAVVFGTPMASADYKVVLTPDGFYPVGTANKTVNGFTVVLGTSLRVGQTWLVGFDVFV